MYCFSSGYSLGFFCKVFFRYLGDVLDLVVYFKVFYSSDLEILFF